MNAVMTAPPAPITKGPPGTKTMLMGPPGSGKTHALRTILDADPRLKVFVVFTEPSGLTILGDTDPERFHYCYVPASQAKLETLIAQAESLNTFSQSALQGLSNVNASQYKQHIELLKTLANLKCERCGLNPGGVDKLDTDWVLALDSLSPVNTMALDLVAGGKPFKTISDWGAAIDQEAKLINMLTLGQRCHFVLTAHVSREVDQVQGGVKIMPAALGKGFPQEIGRFFDDVVYTHINGTEFKWSTVVLNVDAKARRLKLGKDFTPSFVPIFEAWKAKGGIIP